MKGHCCFFEHLMLNDRDRDIWGIFCVNFSEKRAGGINKRFIVRNVLR